MRFRQLSLVLLTVSLFIGVTHLAAQDQDKAIINPSSAAKFTAIPNAPACFTISVEKGDPTKGPSVILAKFAPGCVAPFHWHTPSETVMIVSGSLEAQMKDGKPFVSHRGDYLFMPPRHPHRATCQGTAPCLVFLTSDAAFDIHWINAEGQEISLDEAMKAAKAPRQHAKK